MREADVVSRCLTERVGVSTIEQLPAGGVRLVCMSVKGADIIRHKLKYKVLKGCVKRERHKPTPPRL
jgi:hypothetical protein